VPQEPSTGQTVLVLLVGAYMVMSGLARLS